MLDINEVIITMNDLDNETKSIICATVSCPKNIHCDACPLTNLYEKEELDEWYSRSSNKLK